MARTKTPPPCPGRCDHTDGEHAAFDAGWEAAVTGTPRKARQRSAVLRDAWEWGWDFGASIGGKELGHATSAL